jgi:hydroxyethylthiazole kinase-like uncharacterized protein yjeF
LEASHGTTPAAPSLMQSAGLALARLTLALAPHARTIWVACGPGNNGGDGLQAAAHLQQWGKQVRLSLVHDPRRSPSDAQAAWQAAAVAGVGFSDGMPAHYDACIDALFGIGAQRPLQGAYADWVHAMNGSAMPTLAADVPSGLDADTGAVQPLHVIASHTLSLLTLKPGLFTGAGRDACGDIWFNDLGVRPGAATQAWLQAAPPQAPRQHTSHKGSYGDVCVLGGAEGMAGAALLAARSALHGGAGRVYVCPLDATASMLDSVQPELMFRRFADLDWSRMTLVAGCGGGQDIAGALPDVLARSTSLVLDADALNHIAQNPALQPRLAQRPLGSTVMTPHPLEAARLLGSSSASIQGNRLAAAQALAQRFQCVVVLKGSGTVIAAPGAAVHINPTGNAKLASAGTGDVLAGLLGAYLASGMPALDAACAAVYRHGQAADHWQGTVLSAASLCQWT